MTDADGHCPTLHDKKGSKINLTVFGLDPVYRWDPLPWPTLVMASRLFTLSLYTWFSGLAEQGSGMVASKRQCPPQSASARQCPPKKRAKKFDSFCAGAASP